MSPDKKANETSPASNSPTWKKSKLLTILGSVSFITILGVLANLADITGYNLDKVLGGDTEISKFAYTVYLHNTKAELIEEIEGREVELDLPDITLDASIAEGQAHFKINQNYIDQTAQIRVRRSNKQQQAYQNIHLDSVYVLTKEGKAKVVVGLPGLDKINGRVTDFVTQKTVDSVRISINQHVFTYTNKFGEFELDIPPEYQEKKQRLIATKKQYCEYTIDALTHTKDRPEIVLRPRREGKDCNDPF